LHERLGENTHQTERLLFQIHSIVFDKTEQILCFIGMVAKNPPQQSQQEQPLRTTTNTDFEARWGKLTDPFFSGQVIRGN